MHKVTTCYSSKNRILSNSMDSTCAFHYATVLSLIPAFRFYKILER